MSAQLSIGECMLGKNLSQSKWYSKASSQKMSPITFDTVLYLPNGDRFPRSLEYSSRCVEIVEYIMHVKKCKLDEVLDKLKIIGK